MATFCQFFVLCQFFCTFRFTFFDTYNPEEPARLIGLGVSGVWAGLRNADNQPIALKLVNKSHIPEWVKVNDVLMPLEVAMMFK